MPLTSQEMIDRINTLRRWLGTRSRMELGRSGWITDRYGYGAPDFKRRTTELPLILENMENQALKTFGQDERERERLAFKASLVTQRLRLKIDVTVKVAPIATQEDIAALVKELMDDWAAIDRGNVGIVKVHSVGPVIG